MRKRTKIDDSILAADIKKVSNIIGRVPRQEDYKKEGSFGLNTILLRKPWNQWLMDIFGQTNARERRTAYIPDEEIINDIKQVEQKICKIPTQREYEQEGKYLISMIQRRKKWNEWLELACGATNHNISRTSKIPDQELVNDILRVAKELGHIPTRGEYDKLGHYAPDTITSRKPWCDFAQDACGIHVPKQIPVNVRKITDEELIAQLINLNQKLGRIPTKDDLGGTNGFGSSPYVRAFGTLGKALVAAGLINPLHRCCVPRQEILDELKRVYSLLGHTPSEEEFLENSPMKSCQPIRYEFDSWTKALIEANIPVIRANKISAEDIKIALKKWHNENGHDDTCLEYWKIRKAKQNMKFPYSCNTISSKFDFIPWENIMYECGFPNYTTKDYFVHGQIKRGNHTGKDGNEYLSTIEQDIGDRLFELKTVGKILTYEYEVRVCAEKLWTCDFRIYFLDDSILWLEADGMRNNRKNPYTSGTNEKIEFYKKNGMRYEIISYNCANICQAVDKIIDQFQKVT